MYKTLKKRNRKRFNTIKIIIEKRKERRKEGAEMGGKGETGKKNNKTES
jgi:hypothetical protein